MVLPFKTATPVRHSGHHFIELFLITIISVSICAIGERDESLKYDLQMQLFLNIAFFAILIKSVMTLYLGTSVEFFIAAP